MAASAKYVERMRSAALIALLEGHADAHAVAEATGVSVRTMQRHLNAFGTTFSRELLALRRQAACRMLRETEMPIATIAGTLGYSELSSFTRAFRQWTGSSPSTFRKDARAGAHSPGRASRGGWEGKTR